MIDAEIKHKIPKLENWEDILTSNVFGLLELIDYKYLIEIVSKAKNYNNEQLENKLKGRKIKSVELWQSFEKIGQPDVLIYLDNGEFFIIEVKYYSHEHNKKTRHVDSDDMEQLIEKGQLSKYLDTEIDKKRSDFIVYLTANYRSIKEIENSQSDSKKYLDKIFHIHWDTFADYIGEIKKDTEGCEKNVVDKLITYLEHKGFKSWEGFSYNEAYNLQITTRGFYEDK